jgi:hypothetical protein
MAFWFNQWQQDGWVHKRLKLNSILQFNAKLSHILSSPLGFDEFMMVAKITSCDNHCGCALIRTNYGILID